MERHRWSFCSFLASFFELGPSGCQGPPRDPKLTILATKMRPKSFQKWSKKRTEKYIEKSSKNDAKMVSKMEVVLWPGWLLFEVLFGSGFFEVPRAPQGAKINDFTFQNGPPKLPKWTTKVPKMVPESPSEPPKVIPNTISEWTDVWNNNVNLDGHRDDSKRFQN